MPIFFSFCPQCDNLKAVEVEVRTEREGGDGYWSHTFTTTNSERAPDLDDCVCVLTPDEEQAVIASAEDDAINAGPSYPDP